MNYQIYLKISQKLLALSPLNKSKENDKRDPIAELPLDIVILTEYTLLRQLAIADTLGLFTSEAHLLVGLILTV